MLLRWHPCDCSRIKIPFLNTNVHLDFFLKKKNLKATCNFREKRSIQKNILEKKLKGNQKLEKKKFLACLVLEVARESEINLEGSGNGAR